MHELDPTLKPNGSNPGLLRALSPSRGALSTHVSAGASPGRALRPRELRSLTWLLRARSAAEPVVSSGFFFFFLFSWELG